MSHAPICGPPDYLDKNGQRLVSAVSRRPTPSPPPVAAKMSPSYLCLQSPLTNLPAMLSEAQQSISYHSMLSQNFKIAWQLCLQDS